MIKLVSWDVDGTLFSYQRLAVTLLRLAPLKWRETGLIESCRHLRETWDFHALVEKQRRQADSRVCEEQLLPYTTTYAREKHAMQLALARMAPPANVRQALESFDRAGIVQVALSDFECDYKLRALGIERYFARTYSCREFGFWKPSPIPLARVQADLGVRPQEHLHIGDRDDADGLACLENGCKSAKPTVCISALQAIINS
jgi:FMN phosphatase YigB (HAD superfamily)